MPKNYLKTFLRGPRMMPRLGDQDEPTGPRKGSGFRVVNIPGKWETAREYVDEAGMPSPSMGEINGPLPRGLDLDIPSQVSRPVAMGGSMRPAGMAPQMPGAMPGPMTIPERGKPNWWDFIPQALGGVADVLSARGGTPTNFMGQVAGQQEARRDRSFNEKLQQAMMAHEAAKEGYADQWRRYQAAMGLEDRELAKQRHQEALGMQRQAADTAESRFTRELAERVAGRTQRQSQFDKEMDVLERMQKLATQQEADRLGVEKQLTDRIIGMDQQSIGMDLSAITDPEKVKEYKAAKAKDIMDRYGKRPAEAMRLLDYLEKATIEKVAGEVDKGRYFDRRSGFEGVLFPWGGGGSGLEIVPPWQGPSRG